MKMISVLFFILASIVSTSAQLNVEGRVTDESGKGIFFATLALYDRVDSTLVSTASSDEKGYFIMKEIPQGEYFLEATMLGYAKSVVPILHPVKNGKPYDLILKENAQVLKTVEVKSRRPILEQKADRLVVHVSENITSINSNLLDVMKKVPGVIVAGNKIRLAGATNLTILINGKTTKYMDMESLLRDMPGDNIQKVEIIRQPGAEFDASGTGPIINIILKKNSLWGTHGSIRGGVAYGEASRWNTGVQLSNHQGPLTVNGGLGWRKGGYRETFSLHRKVKGDRYEQITFEPNQSESFRGNTSLDWDIDDKNRVGIQSRYIRYTANNETRSSTSIDYKSDSLPDILVQTLKHAQVDWNMFSANPYYTIQWDTTGHKIDLDLNYIRYWSSRNSTLTNREQNFELELPGQRYIQPGSTQIYVAKIDYTYPISPQLTLQSGVKYSLADLDNDLQAYYQRRGEKEWLSDTTQSNHYLFSESIGAIYSKFTFKVKQWYGTLGLRYEDSRSKGRSVGIDTVLERKIPRVFPSLSIGRSIAWGLEGTLAYSYRIERPSYSTLNPFIFNLDSYTSQRGNPTLRPEYTNSTKFSLSYQKQPFFNVEYKSTRDAMVEVLEQNDELGTLFKSTVNFDKKKEINLSLFFPLSFIPKTDGYGGIMVNNTSFDAPYLGQKYDVNVWSYTGFFQANIALPYDIVTEINGFYTTGGLESLLIMENLYGVDLGISRKFLDNKLKVSAGVDNLIVKYFHGDVQYSNIDLDVISRWEAPVYNVQVSYKFGNPYSRQRKIHESGAAEELRRAGNKN